MWVTTTLSPRNLVEVRRSNVDGTCCLPRFDHRLATSTVLPYCSGWPRAGYDPVLKLLGLFTKIFTQTLRPELGAPRACRRCGRQRFFFYYLCLQVCCLQAEDDCAKQEQCRAASAVLSVNRTILECSVIVESAFFSYMSSHFGHTARGMCGEHTTYCGVAVD